MALDTHDARALGLTDRRHVSKRALRASIETAATTIESGDLDLLPIVAANLRRLLYDLGE